MRYTNSHLTFDISNSIFTQDCELGTGSRHIAFTKRLLVSFKRLAN